MDHWATMTAADLGRDIEQGRVNPVDLTEYFLDTIAAYPIAARIYARTTATRARGEAMAAAARAKSGLRHGPLDGVPLPWKDLFDTAGIATEAGSALLKGRTPTTDAAVLTTATLHGAICLGKTHLSELAFSGLGLNPVTATPPCINDPDAVAGGSSSGAAASVAHGLAPAAVGSDTDGSVRIPAAWNDLVGLKTSHGLLPTSGTVPLCDRFDTIGPLARDVRDCALLLALLQGRKPATLAAITLPNTRLLILETTALDDLRPRPAQAFDEAIARLTRAGAQITQLAAPEVPQAIALAGTLFAAEAYATWGPIIEAAPEKMFPRILERFRTGANVKATDYIAAWATLKTLRQSFAARTAGYDAVLLPTSPILPPNAQRLLTDADFFTAENLLALRNTRIGNLMDQCVLTLPTGHASCGLSLMAPPGHDYRLLALGQSVERALA